MKPETKTHSNPSLQACQNCKNDFTIEVEDFNFYEKIKVPAPTFCPECRFQRRVSWRNERIFSHRNCDKCNNKIISIYSNGSIKVFCQNCWLSEEWEATEYNQEYFFDKSFFIQFIDLFKKVPQVNLIGHALNKNSPYVNYIVNANSCYLCFGGGYIENVMFSSLGVDIKDSAEIYFSSNCENCYEISNCQNCYRSFFCRNSKDCMDSYFLQDCTNCSNCILSCNLRNKTYFFKNVQLTKEDFFVKKEEFLGKLHKSPGLIVEEFKNYLLDFPKKFSNITKSENCTGDNVSESSNVKNCFSVKKSEDCKNSQDIINMIKDVYDSTSIGLNTQIAYESLTASMNVSNIKFSCISRNNSMNIYYSYFMTSCSNCFGCIGLKNKSYCILNKQYTKEAYEDLLPKIIKHMSDMPYVDSKGRIYKYGEFFPMELSPFAYNETIAQEYFPLTKEEALKQGYKWKEKEVRNYNIDIKNEDIPFNTKEVDDSILGKVIECCNKGNEQTQCTEAFKIIPQELQFYQRMNLPLPHLCPNCRHYARLKQRNPLKLWHRKCMKEGCTNEFETSYSPDRPEIVYCESCYNKEVY